MLLGKKIKKKKLARGRQKYPRHGTARDYLGVKIAWHRSAGLFFRSIGSLTSCFFSLEIFNSKLNRYPEDALYARNGSRSCKNITRGRGRCRLKNAEAVWKGRWLSSAARHRKISDNYLPSNIHLEGKLIKKVLSHVYWVVAGFFNGCLGKREG